MKRLEQIARQFDLKDVINMLTEYDIIHQAMPQLKGKLSGLVQYDRKRIFVDTEQDFSQRRNTIIHELLHIYSRVKLLKLTEEQIKELAGIIERREYDRI